MLDHVLVANRAALPDEQFEAMRRVLCRQTSVERALAWWFGQTPPLAPEDIVSQDEFSYDLLVPCGEGMYLSYDTS